MTAQTIRAQITETDHPLEGAELVIRWDLTEVPSSVVAVDVRLDRIGRHGAKWVPIQVVDQYLADLPEVPDYGDAA